MRIFTNSNISIGRVSTTIYFGPASILASAQPTLTINFSLPQKRMRSLAECVMKLMLREILEQIYRRENDEEEPTGKLRDCTQNEKISYMETFNCLNILNSKHKMVFRIGHNLEEFSKMQNGWLTGYLENELADVQ
jgi:hypothetical protein